MPAVSLRQTLRGLTPPALQPLWDRLHTSSLGYRLARGAFWSLVGAVLSRGLGLAAAIVVARTLGKECYGQLGIIRGTVEMFATFAGFGLGLTATKYVAELRQAEPARAGRILMLSSVVAWTTGLVATLLLALSAPWLAAHTLSAPALAPELRLGSLLVLVGAVNGAQRGALAGFEAFKRITWVGLWTGLVNFPALILGAWLFGLKGVIVGLITAQALGCVFNRLALVQESRRTGVPLWTPHWLGELGVLWKFSLPAVLASSFITPVYWFCQTLLVRQPSGYNGMADFAVGAQWRALAQYLPALLCAAYLPVASSAHARAHSGTRKLMFGGTLLSGVLTGGIGLAVFLVSPWLLAAYGHGFASARWVLMWMLVAATFDSINNILVGTLMASGRAWLRLLSNGLWAALVLVCALVLVPRYLALGLAIALCLAQGIHLVVQFGLSLYVTRPVRLPLTEPKTERP